MKIENFCLCEGTKGGARKFSNIQDYQENCFMHDI